MKKLFILTICLSLISTNIFAQRNDDYKKHPGYVDFGNLDDFKNAEETVEVFIKGPILKFVARATAHEDPALSKLIRDLVLIKVNTFSIQRSQVNDIKSIITKVSKKLDSKKWEMMVRVKEKDEYVEIYTQFGKDDQLSGLVVMAVEDDEAVFVNIVGKIDPDQLGKLSEKFDIPNLDSVEYELKKRN